MFETIRSAPPDPILGLSDAFGADLNADKINLGVGVYKDESGVTPILRAVVEAERRLLDSEETKSYLPIDGDPAYGRAVQELLFGPDSSILVQRRAATSHTVGGTGGLRVAADYIHTYSPSTTVWFTTPTWANHEPVFASVGLQTRAFPYYRAATHGLDFDAVVAALRDIPRGDVIVWHGCCHNPTGVDPTSSQWQQIAEIMAERGIVPLVDFAYQGFADGLVEDAAGLRAICAMHRELFICSSFSKNFGLYRERVGALTVVAATSDVAQAVQSNVKVLIRRNYSNPPAHGAQIVRLVLNDAELKELWLGELASMRERINGMRRALAEGLDRRRVRLSPDGNGFIEQQRGMFSMSGLDRGQVERLRQEHSIYVVGSGRINVAAITPTNLDYLCDAIAQVQP